MSDRPQHFTADGFWHFMEHGAPGVASGTVHDFLATGIARAKGILVSAGFTPEELVRERPSVLRQRVPQGSKEDVAFGLLAAAMASMAMLNAAKPSAKMTLIEMNLLDADRREVKKVWQPDGFQPGSGDGEWVPDRDIEAEWIKSWDARMAGLIDAAAASVADFGVRYAILHTMTEGLTRSAQEGRKSQKQRQAASKAAAEVSRNSAWHADATRLWQENPSWSATRMAKRVAHLHSTANHVVAERSVYRSIQSLIPPTSPSYKGD